MSNGTILRLKHSGTAGVVPAAASLYDAELAINTADANLFTKRSDGTVLVQALGAVQHGQITLADTTANQVIDTLDAVLYRSAKYVIQTTIGTDFQTIEILLMHNGSDVYVSRYGLMFTGTELAEFTAEYDATNDVIKLLSTPSANGAEYKFTRTVVQA